MMCVRMCVCEDVSKMEKGSTFTFALPRNCVDTAETFGSIRNTGMCAPKIMNL